MKNNGKHIFCSIVGFLFFLNAGFAQVKMNIYYLKNSGETVNKLDSADYIRIVSEPDSGSNLYKVTEIYKNQKIKFIGFSRNTNGTFLEGYFICYYQNGKKQRIGNYEDNVLKGDVVENYPNGNRYTEKQYIPKEKQEFLIQTCNDSLGKPMVVNGDGHYIGYASDFKNIEEEGDVINEQRDGIWTGGEYTKTSKITFSEKYDKGDFISGESTDESGAKFTYSKRLQMPEFKDGEEAFGKFLQKNLKYPSVSRESKIQGRVFISFIVELDGSLSKLEILRAPNKELGDEVLRVMQSSPKWVPGKRFGKPLKVTVTVPVNFTLGNELY